MRRHEPLVDVGTALVLAAGCVLLGVVLRADAGYFLLSLLLLLPLAAPRRHPVPCAAVVLSGAFVQWLTVRNSIGALPADLAVPMVAIHRDRHTCVLGMVKRSFINAPRD